MLRLSNATSRRRQTLLKPTCEILTTNWSKHGVSMDSATKCTFLVRTHVWNTGMYPGLSTVRVLFFRNR